MAGPGAEIFSTIAQNIGDIPRGVAWSQELGAQEDKRQYEKWKREQDMIAFRQAKEQMKKDKQWNSKLYSDVLNDPVLSNYSTMLPNPDNTSNEDFSAAVASIVKMARDDEKNNKQASAENAVRSTIGARQGQVEENLKQLPTVNYENPEDVPLGPMMEMAYGKPGEEAINTYKGNLGTLQSDVQANNPKITSEEIQKSEPFQSIAYDALNEEAGKEGATKESVYAGATSRNVPMGMIKDRVGMLPDTPEEKYKEDLGIVKSELDVKNKAKDLSGSTSKKDETLSWAEGRRKDAMSELKTAETRINTLKKQKKSIADSYLGVDPSKYPDDVKANIAEIDAQIEDAQNSLSSAKDSEKVATRQWLDYISRNKGSEQADIAWRAYQDEILEPIVDKVSKNVQKGDRDKDRKAPPGKTYDQIEEIVSDELKKSVPSVIMAKFGSELLDETMSRIKGSGAIRQPKHSPVASSTGTMNTKDEDAMIVATNFVENESKKPGVKAAIDLAVQKIISEGKAKTEDEARKMVMDGMVQQRIEYLKRLRGKGSSAPSQRNSSVPPPISTRVSVPESTNSTNDL